MKRLANDLLLTLGLFVFFLAGFVAVLAVAPVWYVRKLYKKL